jgi:hypothetical protein
VGLYEELIAFEEMLLDRMVDLSRDMQRGDEPMVEQSDIEPPRSVLRDDRLRRALWQERDRGLAGKPRRFPASPFVVETGRPTRAAEWW